MASEKLVAGAMVHVIALCPYQVLIRVHPSCSDELPLRLHMLKVIILAAVSVRPLTLERQISDSRRSRLLLRLGQRSEAWFLGQFAIWELHMRYLIVLLLSFQVPQRVFLVMLLLWQVVIHGAIVCLSGHVWLQNSLFVSQRL